MRATVFVGTSLDGFIARPNGGTVARAWPGVYPTIGDGREAKEVTSDE